MIAAVAVVPELSTVGPLHALIFVLPAVACCACAGVRLAPW
jgi:hypothetical protein